MSKNVVHDTFLDWLIDFNRMSTRLSLFYAERLKNRAPCIFLFNFFISSFFFRLLFHWIQMIFKQIYYIHW